VFSTYDPAEARWVPLERDSEAFAPRRFPPETVVELAIEDRVVRIAEAPPVARAREKRKDSTAEKPKLTDKDRNLPQVFILSSGDITPFELRLRPANGKPGIRISVAENGSVKQVRDES
jgi:hypothetical protein